MNKAFLYLLLACVGLCPLVPVVRADDKAPSQGELRVGVAEVKPRTPGTIRLATYNAENLFDTKDDPTLKGRDEDIDDAKPVAHLKALAESIRRLDADVIAMQEIESLEAVTEFRDTYLQGLGYDHIVSIDAGDSRGIEQSVISRFPLKDAHVWKDVLLDGPGHPEKFPDGGKVFEFGQSFDLRRSPLRVTATVPADRAGGKAYDLTLFVVHHKSGRGYGYWREAEAKKVVQFVGEWESAHPGANIAVLGDFNAEPAEAPVQAYLNAGMIDVLASRAKGDRAFFTHASERVIDLILVNKNLNAEVVGNSGFVLATPQLPREADWRTAPKPAGYASDHSPVVIDLKPVDQ